MQVAGSAGRFSTFVSLSLFFHSRWTFKSFGTLRQRISVVSVADADCLWLGDREGKPSRGACLDVQRSVHSRSLRSRHAEESTLSLVLSLGLTDICEESRMQSMRQVERCLLRACSCMAQLDKRLEFCLGVSCKNAWFVSSRLLCVHPPVDRFRSCSPQKSRKVFLTRSTDMMNNVANTFAVFLRYLFSWSTKNIMDHDGHQGHRGNVSAQVILRLLHFFTCLEQVRRFPCFKRVLGHLVFGASP